MLASWDRGEDGEDILEVSIGGCRVLEAEGDAGSVFEGLDTPDCRMICDRGGSVDSSNNSPLEKSEQNSSKGGPELLKLAKIVIEGQRHGIHTFLGRLHHEKLGDFVCRLGHEPRG